MKNSLPKRAAAIAGLAGTLALSLSACSSNNNASSASQKDEQIVKTALATTTSTKSARFQSSISVDILVPGSPETITSLEGSGLVNFASQKASVGLVQSGPEGLLGAYLSNCQATPSSQQGSQAFNILFSGSDSYLAAPDGCTMPAGKSWIKISDSDKSSNISSVPLTTPYGLISSLSSITGLVATIATTKIDGVMLTQYRALVDAKVLAKDLGIAGQTLYGSTFNAEPAGVPVDVWVDPSGRITRFSYSGATIIKSSLTGKAGNLPSSLTPKVYMGISLLISNFGNASAVPSVPMQKVVDVKNLH